MKARQPASAAPRSPFDTLLVHPGSSSSTAGHQPSTNTERRTAVLSALPKSLVDRLASRRSAADGGVKAIYVAPQFDTAEKQEAHLARITKPRRGLDAITKRDEDGRPVHRLEANVLAVTKVVPAAAIEASTGRLYQQHMERQAAQRESLARQYLGDVSVVTGGSPNLAGKAITPTAEGDMVARLYERPSEKKRAVNAAAADRLCALLRNRERYRDVKPQRTVSPGGVDSSSSELLPGQRLYHEATVAAKVKAERLQRKFVDSTGPVTVRLDSAQLRASVERLKPHKGEPPERPVRRRQP